MAQRLHEHQLHHALQAISPFGTVHRKLVAALAPDSRHDNEDIRTLIEVDPVLSAGVLRVANSPVFSRGTPLASLTEAITRVGLLELRRIAETAIMAEACDRGLVSFGWDANRLWLNTLVGAIASEVIAAELRLPGDDAYTSGILRHLGRIVAGRALSEHLPELRYDPAKCSLLDWERRHIGHPCHEVTARIMQGWRWPAELYQAVLHQYRPATAAEEHRAGAALICLGAKVARDFGLGLPGEDQHFASLESCFEILGGDVDLYEEVRDTVRDRVGRVDRMIGRIGSRRPAAPPL